MRNECLWKVVLGNISIMDRHDISIHVIAFDVIKASELALKLYGDVEETSQVISIEFVDQLVVIDPEIYIRDDGMPLYSERNSSDDGETD